MVLAMPVAVAAGLDVGIGLAVPDASSPQPASNIMFEITIPTKADGKDTPCVNTRPMVYFSSLMTRSPISHSATYRLP